MNDSSTDCRSEVGITVGLIDGLIAIGRVLRHRDLSPREVAEALKDLRTDEDINFLLGKQEDKREVTPPRYDEVFQEGMKTLNAEDTLVFDPTSKTYTLAEIRAKYFPNRDIGSEAAVSTSQPFSIMDYL